MTYRVLYDEKAGEEANTPTMPIVIAMEGLVCEASDIKGAVAIVIGNQYLDSPDENLDWNMRVIAARKECMKALSRGIEAVVYDSRIGVVKDNYAAEDDDEDYGCGLC